MKLLGLLILTSVWFTAFCQLPNGEYNFNSGWEFVKDADTTIVPELFNKKEILAKGWEKISLPHTANIEPLANEGFQWQGYCYYRKFFDVSFSESDKHVAINFEAAMQVADVYLNGEYLMTHKGGYLPFYVDLTERARIGKENCILIRLNNQDNPTIPPGSSIKKNGYPYYSGIFRNVQLVVKDKIHITDPVFADRVAGGGIYVCYSNVSQESANVQVKADIQNDGKSNATIGAIFELKDTNGNIVSTETLEEHRINSGEFLVLNSKLTVRKPELWSPDNPYLYTLGVKVLKKGIIIDKQELKIGIRSFSITSKDGFVLNGKKLMLNGTNRHDEYPYIGMALSDNAQYRDAWRIKQDGFNIVRTSHYPQSNSFLQACDELGLMVMDPIPGFQFFGNAEFQDNSIRNIRDMVRRDRNHPSVVLWEASLNETEMSKEFMQRAHQTVHEELPAGDVYTCGWKDGIYDVFIPARAHAIHGNDKKPEYWTKYAGGSPLFIAEYGDWEYYAQNGGFNQTAFSDLLKEERSSRQGRGFGSKRLFQASLNYMEAMNDNLQGNIIGQATWLFIEHIVPFFHKPVLYGNMDIFRLPKFAYWYYRSQSDPVREDKWKFNKPVLFIANAWEDPSFKEVTVYSNCDEVELFLNGKIVSRQSPDKNKFSQNLKHPPFTFKPISYEPGTLKAVGYLNGKKVIQSEQKTPGNAKNIQLSIDTSGKELKAGCNDLVFVRATITDENGTVITDNSHMVKFSLKGDAKFIGDNPVKAEAGIASILLQAGNKPGIIRVTAQSEGVGNTEIKANSYPIK